MTSAARWFYSTSFHQIRPEPEPTLPRVVCAWCRAAGVVTVMREGSLPQSDGICPECLAAVRAENQARRVAR